MVCKSLLKPRLKLINNYSYDAMEDEIEVYVRVMDSVHY